MSIPSIFTYLRSMMKQKFLAHRFTLVVGFLLSAFALHSQCPIIPHPTNYQQGKGSMTLKGEISVNSENLPDDLKSYLVRQMHDLFDLNVVFSSNGRHLEFQKLQNVPKDHYSIQVADKITVSYSSEASSLYALNSLIQLFKEENGYYILDHCLISDQPRFEWRGMHLDVSRHFFTIDEVKRFLDLMAYYKFNTFHWHLTDDQGWRIEIKKYPKLTSVGAWRDSTVNDHYSTVPRTYSKERYGGFYTQEEIREVVRYASKLHINVVPEIEMPGHARAALAAYPEHSCTGEQQGVEGLWGVFEDIYCSKPETIQFQKEILEEVLALFPSEYIHIGGDEAPKDRWKQCSKCQEVIQSNGLKDEHELQSYFIKQIDAFLTERGRKLIGWDEILEGGLSPNATVMSWRGFDGGVEAASQGHNVVMSPGSHCYFDHYQSKHPGEPLAIGGFTPLEKVYAFDPVASGMTSEQARYVLGGQANVWTEYIPDFKKIEYMVFPRALALSQALWCEQKPEYAIFKESLIKHHLPFLKQLDVNYSEAMFYPELKIKRNEEGLEYLIIAETAQNLKLERLQPSSSVSQTIGNPYTLERSMTSKVQPFAINIKSENLSNDTQFNILEHPSIGIGVEYITPPSKSYNSGGDLTLVDGIVGALPWRGNEWIGFREKEIELIVDLGTKKKMEAIDLNFLTDHGSWIHQPEKVQFEISTNKKKWKELKTSAIQLYTKKMSSGRNLPIGTDIGKRGRYLKIKIQPFEQIPEGMPGSGSLPWTFMDELIVYFN
jgi:hexosaminidase